MYLHQEITQSIMHCYYKVFGSLGTGFLEKVYENAMRIELKSCGLDVKTQERIEVYYKQQSVGVYFADILVAGKVIIELKAAAAITLEHEVQWMNYLKAPNIEVGLLLNFGASPEFKRKIFTNDRK